MDYKLFLVLFGATVYLIGSIETASLPVLDKNSMVISKKMDCVGVVRNVRKARQTYAEGNSGEDSEYNKEDEADSQHQETIKHQHAYEQTLEGSLEKGNEGDGDYFGRRLRRDVSVVTTNNVTANISQLSGAAENQDKQSTIASSTTSPATTSSSDSSNTSVLILIRDAIKKVTELPNTQQVATSAQQYFQLFEHFLQQTIEQVIGDDDEDEDEVESTTILPETEKEKEPETLTAVNASDKPQEIAISDKENELLQLIKKPLDTNEIKV